MSEAAEGKTPARGNVASSSRGSAGSLSLSHPMLGKVCKVELGKIKVDPVQFQIRDPLSDRYLDRTLRSRASREVTAELVETIQRGEALDPMVVWEDPQGQLLVIDGHHRHEAYGIAETSPKHKVQVQKFKGTTAAEARVFALEINKRAHNTMGRQQQDNAVWLLLLCGEIEGTKRGLAQMYGVGESTAGRMKNRVEEVRGHLQKLWEQRDAYAVTEMDSGFIRANAPRWKEVNTWLETDNKGAVDMEAMEEKAIEGIVRELGIKYAKTLTVRPDRFLEAIKRLYQEELGRPIDIRNLTPGEAEEGGLECDF